MLDLGWLFEKGVSRSVSPLNDLEASGCHRLVCRVTESELSELEWEGDSIPRGFWQAWRVHVASYPFTISCAEIAEFAKVECSGGKGMRVINCLNCALVFGFRQIPPPYRVQSSLACQHVIVTTCWETYQLSHLQLGQWWSENPIPSAWFHLQISPDVGILRYSTAQGDSYSNANSKYCEPGPVLDTLHALTHFLLITTYREDSFNISTLWIKEF